MGLLDRLRGKRPGVTRAAGRDDHAHLQEWAGSHDGVEGFVEPRTAVTETTLLLVAADGEWTRRRVEGPEAARKLAHRLKMPVYDVQLVGYPQRMRDHDARQKILRERQRRDDVGGS
ncbi:MAG: oxidoreductase [Pseudonocardia sp.]|nr:oxidoreductase [Pseudonocardia sp.]